MRLPFCEKDLNEGKLCGECSKKEAAAALEEIDFKMCRLLVKTEKKFYPFEVAYRKSLDMGDLVVLIGEGKIGPLIGKNGRVVRELSRGFNKTVRVIEHTKDEKKMIQDLVGSARVLGVNKIFEEGKEEIRVIVAERDREKLIAPREGLEKAIEKLLNKKAGIEFV